VFILIEVLVCFFELALVFIFVEVFILFLVLFAVFVGILVFFLVLFAVFVEVFVLFLVLFTVFVEVFVLFLVLFSVFVKELVRLVFVEISLLDIVISIDAERSRHLAHVLMIFFGFRLRRRRRFYLFLRDHSLDFIGHPLDIIRKDRINFLCFL